MSVPGCACTTVKASGSAIHACDVKYSSERVTRSTFIGASIWTGAKVGALCASVRAFVIIVAGHVVGCGVSVYEHVRVQKV